LCLLLLLLLITYICCCGGLHLLLPRPLAHFPDMQLPLPAALP
jgi:hypothetical protein